MLHPLPVPQCMLSLSSASHIAQSFVKHAIPSRICELARERVHGQHPPCVCADAAAARKWHLPLLGPLAPAKPHVGYKHDESLRQSLTQRASRWPKIVALSSHAAHTVC